MVEVKRKILIIDDEPGLLKIMGRFLTKLNFSSDLIENGLQGLEIFKKEPESFSAIIIDYNLPNITCSELISQIRTINPKIPIVLSTGFAAEEILRDKQLDVNRTLQKPFTFDEFKKVIEGL